MSLAFILAIPHNRNKLLPLSQPPSLLLPSRINQWFQDFAKYCVGDKPLIEALWSLVEAGSTRIHCGMSPASS